ncbi:MAG: M12 family metallo-peptidase [Candidatus Thiodiazotropha sp.]
MKRYLWGFCLLVLAVGPGFASAQIWQDLNEATVAASRGLANQAPYYRALRANEPMLRQALSMAPLERSASQGATLELPMPGGEIQRVEVVESPILSPALAARYPEVATYSVQGVDNPAVSGRLDMTPEGFHAMLTTPSGSVFIDPDASGSYRSYYKQDYAAAATDESAQHVCHLDELGDAAFLESPDQPLAQRSLFTNSRRVYRLALVATGEYGSYFGTQTQAVNTMITTINRVNQIYGRDLAVQLQISDVIVYLNPVTDPFSDPNSPATMLLENQDLLDYEVGLDNYDIGHLFGRSGGGLAMVGSACTTSRAMGYTGHPTPDVGDPFDIDFVAHEIGHQLSATHSFNGTTDNCSGSNRSAATAVEPGSGSTIMAYAGICGGEDLQNNSDATFHAASMQQVRNFTANGAVGASCGTLVSTGNTLPSTISAGVDVTVPQQTPFVLTGSAGADPDGDTLSYQWDEMDANGTATTVTTIGQDLRDNPLFRSFVPKSTPTRYFPRLSTLISGVTDIGETLPTTSRTLRFRMTVRDGNSGVGDDDVNVTVDASQGPFVITGGVLNNAGNLAGGTTQTLTWDPNNTETDCPEVTINLLSISSDGTTYCDVTDDTLLGPADTSGIPNIGSASVTLPSAQIARARVMLSCDNNVYFALSDNDFSVNAASPVIASDCKRLDGEPLEHGSVFVSHSVSGGSVSTGGGGGGGALFVLPLLLLAGGLSRLLRGDRD